MGLPDDVDLHLEVDETSPFGQTWTVITGRRVEITVEGGAFEDPKRVRQLSEPATRLVLGRLLLRVLDRLEPGFGAPPPDSELTLAQHAAWDAYAAGRYARRAGLDGRRDRRRYASGTASPISPIAPLTSCGTARTSPGPTSRPSAPRRGERPGPTSGAGDGAFRTASLQFDVNSSEIVGADGCKQPEVRWPGEDGTGFGSHGQHDVRRHMGLLVLARLPLLIHEEPTGRGDGSDEVDVATAGLAPAHDHVPSEYSSELGLVAGPGVEDSRHDGQI